MRPGGGGMRPGGGGMRPGGGDMRPGASSGRSSSHQEEKAPPTAEDKASVGRKLKSMIKEYISIEDLAEAEACVKELDVNADRGKQLVESLLDIALNGRSAERHKCIALAGALFEKRLLSCREIDAGMQGNCEFLGDIKIDIPMVDQWIGNFIGAFLSSGVDAATFGPSFGLVKKGMDSDKILSCILLGIVQFWRKEEGRKSRIVQAMGDPTMQQLEVTCCRCLIKDAEFRPGQRILEIIRPDAADDLGDLEDHCCALILATQQIANMKAGGASSDSAWDWVEHNVPKRLRTGDVFSRLTSDIWPELAAKMN